MKIPRRKLERIVREWDERFERVEPTRRSEIVRVKCSGAVAAGASVSISGFASVSTFAAQKKRMLDGSLVLSAAPATANSSRESLATALESIPSGKVGRVRKSDLEFGIVSISDASHQFADATLASATSGVYRIVAKGTVVDGKAVCALVKVGSAPTSTGTAVTDVTTTTGKFVTGVSGVLTSASGTFVSGVSVDANGRLVFSTSSVSTSAGTPTLTKDDAVVSVSKTTGSFYKP